MLSFDLQPPEVLTHFDDYSNSTLKEKKREKKEKKKKHYFTVIDSGNFAVHFITAAN